MLKLEDSISYSERLTPSSGDYVSCGNNGMMNGYVMSKYVRGHYRDEDEEEQDERDRLEEKETVLGARLAQGLGAFA